MYHIKNDKRTHTSARRISDALDKCLERKDFSNITITDILEESTVGRATFYRIFDSLSDVFLFQCDKAFEEIIDNINAEDRFNLSTEEIIIKFTDFWLQHDKLAENLIKSSNIYLLYVSNQKHMKEMIGIINKGFSYSEAQCEYLAGILSSILITWIARGKPESPSDLVHNLDQLVIDLAASLS